MQTKRVLTLMFCGFQRTITIKTKKRCMPKKWIIGLKMMNNEELKKLESIRWYGVQNVKGKDYVSWHRIRRRP